MKQAVFAGSAYRSEIDGLRAFAVLSVVVFHAFPNWIQGGFVGVDVFFVISGFLITTHIFQSLDQGDFSFSDFFGRRVRRIFPALIFVMVCSLVFGWFVLLADEFNQLGKHIAGGAAFISNFIFANEVGYFDTAAELKPMLHLWSLAVEEQFYIFLPLLLWLGWKQKLSLLAICLVVLFASFFVNVYWIERFPTEIYFWPFGRFWELLTGSVLAWVMLYKMRLDSVSEVETSSRQGAFFKLLKRFNRNGITTLIGIVLLASSVFLINKKMAFPSYVALFPVLGAVFVIIGGGVSTLSKCVLSNKLAVWFGLISYPLYLWHWPILSYLHIIEDGAPAKIKLVLAVLLSILLAWLTYQFIEKPLRFGKSNKTTRTTILSLCVLLIACLGLLISRYDFKDIKAVDDVHFRKGLEHRIGSTSRWYQGQGNWLFLGNAIDNTVAKLKLAFEPKEKNLIFVKNTFKSIVDVAETNDIQVVFLLGPNKSTIYREFLPSELVASPTRYVDFYLDRLREIENLTVYDPTLDLLNAKGQEGILYYRTDTHWNSKGAYLAFRSLISALDYKVPNVSFSLDKSVKGDLIDISRLNNFPLENDDNWRATFLHSFDLTRKDDEQQAFDDTFGKRGVVYNSNPSIDKRVWVVGDSFTTALRPFLEATFREVHYIGKYGTKIYNLQHDLEGASEKPELVLIIRTERSF